MYEKIHIKRDDGTYHTSFLCVDEFILPETSEPETSHPFLDMQSPETFSCTIEAESAKQLRKVIIPRGMRNYEILKRDGYLSPRNAERT